MVNSMQKDKNWLDRLHFLLTNKRCHYIILMKNIKKKLIMVPSVQSKPAERQGRRATKLKKQGLVYSEQ